MRGAGRWQRWFEMSYIREHSQQDAEKRGVKRAACFKGEDEQCLSAGSLRM